MKKTVLFILITFFISTFSVATTRIINVQNFSFSPNSLNAFVGDTIKWVWVSGSHTTTSTNIPLGASFWDSPITSVNTSFSYKILLLGTYNYKCTPHESMGMTGVINVLASSITQSENVTLTYTLKQNYPNPFNPTTNISFSIPKSEFVKISIYNEIGKEIETIVNENLNEGSYTVNYNASKLSSGVYFYKISSGDFNETKRMLLIK
ncbi:MAG: T9SS type A sorting domain-containing protein [Ignavibacteriae bacterium]|nr:T9SS type A sorting domain-containing protein [Ignavibacteriota bacterium]